MSRIGLASRLGLAIALCASCAPARGGTSSPTPERGARATLVGFVRDSVTAAPIARASVRLEPAGAERPARTAVTDSAGRFAFESVTAGPYELSIRRLGYRLGQRTWTAAGARGDTLLASLAPAETYVCTPLARPAIEVEVRDSTTDAPMAARVAGIVRDGAYQDTLRVSAYEGASAVTVRAALARAGTYAVMLDAPGYRQWTARAVRVEDGTCHVKTVRLYARMQSLRE